MEEDHPRERLLQAELKRDERRAGVIIFVIGILVVILIANVVYLNSILLKNAASDSATKASIRPPLAASPTSSEVSTPVSVSTETPMPPSLAQSTVSYPQNSIKDYFIPLGSGTNQTSDWADVPGVQAVVNLGQYQNIKEIRFEASVYVPTGNQSVSVRLFNATDKHPVWYSEVAMSENTSASLTSGPIIYEKGDKLYTVQMRTQLQSLANLTQARIHIILK